MISTELQNMIEDVKKDIISGMEKFNIPGLSIAFVEKEGIIWSEGFGYTDKTKQHKVTPDTKFMIGSLSKAYNATAFLRAMQDGRVHLDDPIRKYYQDLTWNTRFGDDELDKLTFRHLLTHFGGLQHFTFTKPLGESKYYTFDEYVRQISASWQKYPVGTRFSYSNAGVNLVAYALQKICGKSFAKYMNDEVYAPLGMNNSYVDPAEAFKAGGCARGFRGDTQVTIEQTLMPYLGSGAQFSSVNDMAKFLMMHLNKGSVSGKKFLDTELLEEMYRIPYAKELQLITIGLGIGVTKNKYGGELLCRFFGDGPGYTNLHLFYPNIGFGLLIQVNQVNGTIPFMLQIIAKAEPVLVKYKLGKVPKDITITDKIKLSPKIPLDLRKAKRLQGTYISRMLDIDVKLQDSKLVLFSQGKEFNLEQHSATEFSCKVYPLLTFDFDQSGRPITIELVESSGRITILDYDSGPEDALGPNKRQWQDYSGIYRYNFGDIALYSTTVVRNGYLHLVTNLGNKIYKLSEYKPGLFFTADGQNVIFENNQLIQPSLVWAKDDITLDRINVLLDEKSKDIRVSKIGLGELLFIYETLDKKLAKELKDIIDKVYPETTK